MRSVSAAGCVIVASLLVFSLGVPGSSVGVEPDGHYGCSVDVDITDLDAWLKDTGQLSGASTLADALRIWLGLSLLGSKVSVEDGLGVRSSWLTDASPGEVDDSFSTHLEAMFGLSDSGRLPDAGEYVAGDLDGVLQVFKDAAAGRTPSHNGDAGVRASILYDGYGDIVTGTDAEGNPVSMSGSISTRTTFALQTDILPYMDGDRLSISYGHMEPLIGLSTELTFDLELEGMDIRSHEGDEWTIGSTIHIKDIALAQGYFLSDDAVELLTAEDSPYRSMVPETLLSFIEAGSGAYGLEQIFAYFFGHQVDVTMLTFGFGADATVRGGEVVLSQSGASEFGEDVIDISGYVFSAVGSIVVPSEIPGWGATLVATVYDNLPQTSVDIPMPEFRPLSEQESSDLRGEVGAIRAMYSPQPSAESGDGSPVLVIVLAVVAVLAVLFVVMAINHRRSRS